MKFIKRFNAFLDTHVNLNQARIDQLDDHVGAIGTFLETGDQDIADRFVQLIPQGSYAQRTIIRPVGPYDEFDADVLLEVEEDPTWEASDYVQNLYTSFRTSSRYRDMVDRKTHCVTVDYANEFHIDVVPYVKRHDEPYITNRKENQFELTNPEGFNVWLDDQNGIARGNLIKVIRLLKYLRDYKNTFSVKSVILTILLGERVNVAKLFTDAEHYRDLPTTLKNVIAALNTYLQANPIMPLISDPSCPSESFNHRWDQEEYANFRDQIKYYSDKIEDAYHESNQGLSLTKWQEVFGEEFGEKPVATAAMESAHVGRARDTEEFLEEKYGITMRLNPAYKLRIDGRITPRNGFRTYSLRRHGNKVEKHRNITFRISLSIVPAPYDVYWKVRNFGDEAIEADCIRGQIVPDGGHHTKVEPTLFRGKHYVECYAVVNGICVAMDRHTVIIV
jgi:hypothetical protein